MPRFPRNYLNTSFFHVITQGINKNFIFDNSIDIKFYIKNMYLVNNKYNVKIIAYCIMNNHAHMLLMTDKLENLSKYMQSLNTRYGRYYNKKYQRVGYVFRDRYKAEGIYSEEQLYSCINYIYNNPVKAGICYNPGEYNFSNYKEIKAKINENYTFIDMDEDKNYLCLNLVNNYLKQNNMEVEELKYCKDKLKEVVTLLKDKYNISFRTMSKIMKINRETIRREYYK